MPVIGENLRSYASGCRNVVRMELTRTGRKLRSSHPGRAAHPCVLRMELAAAAFCLDPTSVGGSSSAERTARLRPDSHYEENVSHLIRLPSTNPLGVL